ncbi:phenylacetic acid degradation protein [Sphingomonas sp. Leaf231]|uniref:PaaI family thioesterase n=1 Tax=Sphingomonas sp. Leaf231 TaxID=1736301 RepID=UPI0006F6DF93|nr:PaaI family thioesterase [Sphingomonas sp. Leaf231]KQN93929.1 phenylacetic acid degradation protein [Sphingomonas sp. Leaf231]
MKLPPYAQLLGVTLELVDDLPEIAMPFGHHVVGRPGFLQGGAIAGLLEVAAVAALRHALAGEDAARVKPINATVDFMRGGRDRVTRAAGTITRLGTRVATVSAIAWQDDRARPIAAARLNYLIERGEA